jgi:hypothetical protein
MRELLRMPDLTLFELTELNKEEIKNRLRQDYSVISYGKGTTGRVRPATRRSMKLVYNNFKRYVINQLKSILVKQSA